MMKQTAHPDFLISFWWRNPKERPSSHISRWTFIITIIHGDVILRCETIKFFKILLMYCVPFCVTTSDKTHRIWVIFLDPSSNWDIIYVNSELHEIDKIQFYAW